MESLLRDLDRERSKMQKDVDNLERHYQQLAGYVSQYVRQAVVEWAKLILNHPRALLLVVETTKILGESGYAISGESEPIRMAGLSLAHPDGLMWDVLVHPTYSHGVGGFEYHGLTLADVQEKPRFADVWPEIAEKLQGRHIIVFGADWARSALRMVSSSRVLEDAYCLHNKAKEYYGEFYELSLETILSYQGIDQKRDELKDSGDRLLVLAQIIRNMAEGMARQTKAEETVEEDLGDLEDHPF